MRRAKLAGDQHRDLGVSEHLLGLAAEQHPGESAAAVRGHENEIALLLLRHGEDGIGGKVAGQVDALAADARVFGRPLDDAEVFGRGPLDHLGVLRRRHVADRHVRLVHHGSGGRGGEQAGNPGADRFGEFHTIGDRLARKRGAVRRDQDVLIHVVSLS